ncbi:helix-turn-helix domain-containing protein [Treponema primitia]|uniref:helix-turn-helix domain-containing protein n=1 Tax=Treponema primitia TaxID=88058 RepID=UPI0039804877
MDKAKTVWAEKMIVIEDLMTIQDVARITQFKVCTIRKFVLKDTIPYIKVGGGLRFRPSEIAAWINRGMKGGDAAELRSGKGESEKIPELFTGQETDCGSNGVDDDGHK